MLGEIQSTTCSNLQPLPGETSRAHNWPLFHDELRDVARNVLELFRQPIEDGSVTIARANMTLSFPSEFHAGGGDEPLSVQTSTDTALPQAGRMEKRVG